MAYTVDWTARRITVPRDDLTLVQSAGPDTLAVYELDLDEFHQEVRRLEASVAGVPNPTIVDYTPPASVDSATTLASVVRVIHDYRVEFDDSPGRYQVRLIGGNSNIHDTPVLVPNGVSVVPGNSAGLVSAAEGVNANVQAVAGTPVSGPDDLKATAMDLWKLDVSIEDDGNGNAVQVWRDDSGSELFRRYLYWPDGSHVPFSDYPSDAVVRRGP